MLFIQDTTYEDLREWLGDQNVNVSIQINKSTFKRWEVGMRLRTGVAETLKLKTQDHFLEEFADDSTILQSLEKDGCFLGKWTFDGLYLSLG